MPDELWAVAVDGVENENYFMRLFRANGTSGGQIMRRLG